MQFSLWDVVHNSDLTSYYVTKVQTEYNRIISLLLFAIVTKEPKNFLSQEEFNLENPNIYIVLLFLFIFIHLLLRKTSLNIKLIKDKLTI